MLALRQALRTVFVYAELRQGPGQIEAVLQSYRAHQYG
jgi:hypothetical protein